MGEFKRYNAVQNAAAKGAASCAYLPILAMRCARRETLRLALFL